MKKRNQGITLIALVITIIVLLILAGISIATLTGENGVLTKASIAQKQTEIEDAKEQAKLDISTWVADRIEARESTKLDDNIIKEILDKRDYVKEAKEDRFTTKKNQYEILYSELYNTTSEKEEITFFIENIPFTAYKEESWYEWTIRNYDIIQNTTFDSESFSSSSGYNPNYIVKSIFTELKDQSNMSAWWSEIHSDMGLKRKTNEELQSANSPITSDNYILTAI